MLPLKDLAKIFVYLLSTVLLGALLAPPLYWAGEGFHFLDRFDFQKFFNRSVLVAAVVLLVPTLRWLRLPGWRGLGLEPDRRWGLRLVVGFLAAFVLVALLGCGLLWAGVYRLKTELPFGRLPGIALTAAAVSLIEEALFRGALLAIMIQALGRVGGVLINSALFAVVHFLEPREGAVAEHAVEWWSGLKLVREAFWQFGEPALVLAGFATLFLVGLVLAWTVLKTRSLWMAIGLHAGWVFGTMGFSKLTKRVIKDTLPWFGASLSVGIGALAMVALTWAAVAIWLRYEHREGDPAGR